MLLEKAAGLGRKGLKSLKIYVFRRRIYFEIITNLPKICKMSTKNPMSRCPDFEHFPLCITLHMCVCIALHMCMQCTHTKTNSCAI